MHFYETKWKLHFCCRVWNFEPYSLIWESTTYIKLFFPELYKHNVISMNNSYSSIILCLIIASPSLHLKYIIYQPWAKSQILYTKHLQVHNYYAITGYKILKISWIFEVDTCRRSMNFILLHHFAWMQFLPRKKINSDCPHSFHFHSFPPRIDSLQKMLTRVL